MCHGDVGMVTYRWGNRSRKPQAAATAHQCIDWDSLAEWTDERTIDMFKPGFLIHPTKGKWAAFAISLLLSTSLLILVYSGHRTCVSWRWSKRAYGVVGMARFFGAITRATRADLVRIRQMHSCYLPMFLAMLNFGIERIIFSRAFILTNVLRL